MKPFLIGVAGPSGAGKSVFCRTVMQEIPGITRLKLDDFFKDEKDVSKLEQWIQWDEPSALKWDELLKAVRELRTGRDALVPDYSRLQDMQVGVKTVLASDIVIIDGFSTLCNSELRDLLNLKLYFDLSEESQLSRRRQRQPDVEDGYLHKIMLPAARRYIMPSKQFADHVIDAEPSADIVAQTGLAFIRTALLNRDSETIK